MCQCILWIICNVHFLVSVWVFCGVLVFCGFFVESILWILCVDFLCGFFMLNFCVDSLYCLMFVVDSLCRISRVTRHGITLKRKLRCVWVVCRTLKTSPRGMWKTARPNTPPTTRVLQLQFPPHDKARGSFYATFFPRKYTNGKNSTAKTSTA